MWSFGLLQVGIGGPSRGLCGGMAFVARDRFERGASGVEDPAPPSPGSALFDEVVGRQFASFGRLFSVPLRFWIAAALMSERRRVRETVRDAWPAVRAEIDGGAPAMMGLVREASWNPLAPGLGHQVVAYRYDAAPDLVTIGIYDPNHPGDDEVEIRIARTNDGWFELGQSTGESLLGLLHLPFAPVPTR